MYMTRLVAVLVLLCSIVAVVAQDETVCKELPHVITYFPSPRVVPGGRGEAVKVALHAAGMCMYMCHVFVYARMHACMHACMCVCMNGVCVCVCVCE